MSGVRIEETCLSVKGVLQTPTLKREDKSITVTKVHRYAIRMLRNAKELLESPSQNQNFKMDGTISSGLQLATCRAKRKMF